MVQRKILELKPKFLSDVAIPLNWSHTLLSLSYCLCMLFYNLFVLHLKEGPAVNSARCVYIIHPSVHSLKSWRYVAEIQLFQWNQNFTPSNHVAATCTSCSNKYSDGYQSVQLEQLFFFLMLVLCQYFSSAESTYRTKLPSHTHPYTHTGTFDTLRYSSWLSWASFSSRGGYLLTEGMQLHAAGSE